MDRVREAMTPAGRAAVSVRGVEEGWRGVGEDVPAMSSTMLDMPEWTI